MRVIKLTMSLLLLLILTACPGSKDDGSVIDPIGDPGSVNLVFPENNSECTEGAAVGDSQSTITFQWEAAQNANSYEVNLKNLENGDTQKTESNTNDVDITLKSNTPYEWYVVSRSSNSEVAPASAKWKFYNAGAGVLNYAPFPAAAVNPKRGESIAATTSVTLEWQGDDVDNDIAEFEVLFGTIATPDTSIGATVQSSIATNIVSGQTYYWQVITKDKAGNTSQSEIFSFKIQ
ncbi:hypothetical protein JQC67_05535 [Aurantibacter crassamenti]|uniref:hypothetical protein n=1 Tax=Aurantibacter crassamenti TaxID=1837375 RepID=UPI00193A6FE9|nr:hypothetical protein [Aurantibacter crassamenti]MBM1105599.1 hypothetical protein [Aurantibacter crassamenti]